jgi:LacI family transcriptional regulator
MTDAAHAAAQHRGFRVPEDLSLVSLAGLPGPRPAAPAMARVILDFEQAGATGATLLLKLVADRSARAEAVLLPAEFDPRGSIAPPAGRPA